MTLAHEYASREPNPEPKPQTQTQTPSPNPKPEPEPEPKPKPEALTEALTDPTGSARLSAWEEGLSAGGTGGMNPSKGEGSIPRCSLYHSQSKSEAEYHRCNTVHADVSAAETTQK